MEFEDFLKNYLWQNSSLDHSKHVEQLSLKLFYKLNSIFAELNIYNNNEDLKLLKYGAVLHDIGVMFEKKMAKSHHKIGRDLILKNKISGLSDEQNLIVANIVRYHRRALPDSDKHKYYKMLNNDLKRKVDILSSIVRLSDALDYNHFDIIDDFELQYDKKERILTIALSINIMLNVGFIEILNKKKDFLETTLDIKVLFS